MVFAVGSTAWLAGSHVKNPDACTTTSIKIFAGSVAVYQLRHVYKFC
jgi:hypothetical protein